MTAQEISLLLMRGFIPKEKFKVLELDDALREEVVKKLHDVGLEFINNPHTDYYGVRPLSHIASFDDIIEEWDIQVPKTFNLKISSKGLLAVLWGLLVFPMLEGTGKTVPAVTFEQLYQNFKDNFNRTSLKGILTQLTRHKFIESVESKYQAGPGLFIYIDHDEMYRRFVESVIRFKVARIRERASEIRNNVRQEGEAEDAQVS